MYAERRSGFVWAVGESACPYGGPLVRARPDSKAPITDAPAPITESAASGDRRVVGPGVGRFQLGGDADEDVLSAVGGGELDADGQAPGVAVQGEADRRLPAHVERRRERGEPPGPPHRCCRVLGVVLELRQRRRR